jgi:hypothetical protein
LKREDLPELGFPMRAITVDEAGKVVEQEVIENENRLLGNDKQEKIS